VFESIQRADRFPDTPFVLIPGISEEILKSSIYQYIQEDLHLKFGQSHRRILCHNDVVFESIQRADRFPDTPFVRFLRQGRLADSEGIQCHSLTNSRNQ
jgi:DNA-binding GntR family transcriptional regulator